MTTDQPTIPVKAAPTSHRAQIARLRRVALAALGNYPLPAGRLRFVTHGENTTFRHDSAGGSHLVRLFRAGKAARMTRLRRWKLPESASRPRPAS